MRVVAIVQARLGSSRLPGKVLTDIVGKSMLERVVERTLAARSIDDLVVATTDTAVDETLAQLVLSRKWHLYRGSSDDVLARYHGAAVASRADVVVRVTADDPLKDPEVIDSVVARLVGDASIHYASNTLKPTFPEGLDVEVFTFGALDNAHTNATLQSEREHVTPYLYKNPGQFSLANIETGENLSHWRWTVDESCDVEFMRRIYAHFSSEPCVSWRRVVTWLKEHPEVVAINSAIQRNAGYIKSQMEDEMVKR